MVPAMEINEMLEMLELQLENNLVSATCEISGGKILITPFNENLDFPLENNANENFADSWYDYEVFHQLGWVLDEPDENGVYSLITV